MAIAKMSGMEVENTRKHRVKLRTNASRRGRGRGTHLAVFVLVGAVGHEARDPCDPVVDLVAPPALHCKRCSHTLLYCTRTYNDYCLCFELAATATTSTTYEYCTVYSKSKTLHVSPV